MIGAAVLAALAGITLAGGFGVVSTRSVVHAAIFLLLSLVGVAGIFLVLLAEFLALVQVLIYGGAVTIVLLFAIMLTRTPEQGRVEDNAQRPLAALVASTSFGLFGVAALLTPWRGSGAPQDPTEGFLSLGRVLFSDFAVAFEVASLVLLVALIGAVVLTRGGRQGT